MSPLGPDPPGNQRGRLVETIKNTDRNRLSSVLTSTGSHESRKFRTREHGEWWEDSGFSGKGRV